MPAAVLAAVSGHGFAREGTAWLQLILTKVLIPVVPPALTIHSAMATLLSWAAKAGLSLGDRRSLGMHAKPGDLSALEYSRDALAGPLERSGVSSRRSGPRSSRRTPPAAAAGRR